MTKTLLTLALLGGSTLAPELAHAQALPSDEPDAEIVVTGTRSLDGASLATSGSSITTLDAPALEQRQTRIVSDVLRDVPGLAVNRAGGAGGTTQVRIRGAEANHTLVLIDGMEVSDPFQGEFDFATLIADDAARVEVLRGPSSAIYGSDAIGGVVHYITASGAEAPGLRARVDAGSFATVNGSARVGGVASGLDYALTGSFARTDGTPTARDGVGDRPLGADNRALSGKLSYDVAPTIRLSAVGRYSRTAADTNPQDFDFTSPTYGFVVDGDEDYRLRAFYGLVRAEATALAGRWTHALTAQINDSERANRDAGDTTYQTRGERMKAAYDTTLRFQTGAGARHSLTGAIDVERERFRNLALFGAPTNRNALRSTRNIGLVGEYGLTMLDDRLGFGASLRHDFNDRFENATTYRLRGSFAPMPALRLRGALGTAIKNPTNIELFGFDPDSFVGNPGLRPERNAGWEAGADLSTRDGRAGLGATWFQARLRNEIFTRFSPSFVASPDNRDTLSRQKGVEVFAHARPLPGWRLDLAYTWLDAEENGQEELRRPRHSGSANVAWRTPDDRVGATITARYNGRMFDNNFTNLPIGPRARLDDYLLVNVAADLRVTESIELFGRVENLLGQEYEELFTYRAPGRAAFAGIRARL